MNDNSGKRTGDTTFTYFSVLHLQALFIGLKLAGLIDWPWWQVFLPAIFHVTILALAFLVLGVISYVEYRC